MGEPDHATMQLAAEERFHTSASATALGCLPSTGVGLHQTLREGAAGAGKDWSPDAKRSNEATQPKPPQALAQGDAFRNKYMSIPQRREEAVQQRLWLLAPPLPTVRLISTKPSPRHMIHSQPHLIQIPSISAIPLPLRNHRHILQSRPSRGQQMQ